MGKDPVTYCFVTKHLQNTIRFIGLNPPLYKSYSFRIGAATCNTTWVFQRTINRKWEGGTLMQFVDILELIVSNYSMVIGKT